MKIAIEGTVGVGKSTLAEILSEELGLSLYEEQFNNPYFDDFYENPEKYAFPMHVQLYHQQYFHAYEALTKGNCVLDRTVYAGQVFMSVLQDNNSITFLDFCNYMEMSRQFNELCPVPDVLIYLTSSKQTVINRIMNRNRKSELSASIEYWYKLHDAYESWFDEYDKSLKISINTDHLDIVNNPEDRARLVNQIKTFLKTNYIEKHYKIGEWEITDPNSYRKYLDISWILHNKTMHGPELEHLETQREMYFDNIVASIDYTFTEAELETLINLLSERADQVE
ncbi:deoxynucleoside kinase [Bacillus phage vB_BceM-HSE3]|nr:deoxynucleoside kinase [Bacillus phage vB_BceM-HSE3]